ncbi:GTPase HflX [Candidatus Babeliales bacterium]|nr:GTPase HflX [Candidatus Babeliales bacterium]
MATRKAESTKIDQPKTIVVCVYAPYNTSGSFESYQDEFLSLVDTANIEYVAQLFCKTRSIIKAVFLTKGKLEDLIELASKHNAERIVISERLTPLQERNIEEMTHAVVVDREQLILGIFKKSAHTSEGKIQVAMAEIEFLKTRMSGKGIEYMQQSGLRGGKGPGETMKEKTRRYFAHQIHIAQRHLDILQNTREMQRKKRLATKIPLIAIIGYTNAGKSSLLNRMTKSDILAENKLFATLDTTTRELYLGENKSIGERKKVLISDTVGFISQLPPQLIKSFQSTLDEVRHSHLLLHVIDLNNPLWEHHIRVVKKTLHDLKVKVPMIYVFNKIDLIASVRLDLIRATMFEDFQPYVCINTKEKDGLQELMSLLQEYQFKDEYRM